ncbi:MAG TPA: hypothetical protein PKX15_06850, partial [Bacteroidales bacterium]|nr:hypothetical protein [Bacteroidales bacterium]
DFFSPDLEKAKIQLAAVTALMDDIEPENNNSPQIIHVVSYSEAIRLANPTVINESIQITLSALKEYRLLRSWDKVPNMAYDKEVIWRTEEMYSEAKDAIAFMEQHIPNLYSYQGLYEVFNDGYFPVPFIIDQNNTYPKARMFTTAVKKGGVKVVDEKGQDMKTLDRYKKIFNEK